MESKMVAAVVWMLACWVAMVVSDDDVQVEVCPAVQTQQDFDVSRYTGTWYVAEHLPRAEESGRKCETVELLTRTDGVTGLQLKESSIQISTNQAVTVDYLLTLPDSNQPAVFNEDSNGDTYQILDTDYTSYSVVFSCVSGDAGNTEHAWIMTRTRGGLTDATRSQIYSSLTAQSIDTSEFLVVDQSSCGQ